MRDFRAKTTKKENREHAFNNIWVEGDLLVSRDKYYIHPRANAFQVNNELSKLIVLHEVIPETLGEYTGLNDKNGKKIFEGDIIKVHVETLTKMWDIIGVVKYYNASYGIAYENDQHFLAFNKASTNVRQYEVIGNIYDHPELLEEV